MLAGALISHRIVKEFHSVSQISPDVRRSCGHLAGIVRLLDTYLATRLAKVRYVTMFEVWGA